MLQRLSMVMVMMMFLGMAACAPASAPESGEAVPTGEAAEVVEQEDMEVEPTEEVEEEAGGEATEESSGAEPADETAVEGQISTGSVIHLENQFPQEGGYLDTRGRVMDKPAFAEVAQTERTFVSTHGSPNRDSGSGSWAIESAEDKEKGDPLVVGDAIHLVNGYPGAGYLDTWGFTERLDVWSQYEDTILGVYTTLDPERIDSGSATWYVRSATDKADGETVVEGDLIHLESAYPDGGYLDVNSRVVENPTFSEYEGQQMLVFTSAAEDRDRGSGTWRVVDADTTADTPSAAAEEAPTGPVEVHGQVLGATTAQALSGAEVCLDGTEQCVTTDETGAFLIADVAAGEHTLSVTASNYIALEHPFTVEAAEPAFQTLALSPNLAAGEIRIVLTWGESADLDSWLFLPSSTIVNYDSRGSLSSAPHAQLDVDDTYQGGPETITISERADGTYNYAVHHYGNVDVVGKRPHVRVYGETGLIDAFTPPAGQDPWWHVFSMDGATGALTPVNVLSAERPIQGQ